MFKPLKTLPFALLAIGGTAEALTLGQIHVQSFINEPLKAVIDVNKATEDEIQALKIKLADRNAFSKVGVDYTNEVQGLRFAIVETPKGTSIEVTSQTSISEPFLSFVIDADWNKGSVSKDYTVLLDPPIYTDRFAPPVAPADAGIVRSDEIPEPVAETETAPVTSEPSTPAEETPAASAAQTQVASGDMKNIGPTAAGSNLWTIARDNKPQAATIQQAMVAIHEANPDAFIRGNMNHMKQGQLLRVPPPEVIEAISQAAAETRISRHQQAWKSGEAIASGERLTPEVVATTTTGSAESAGTATGETASASTSGAQEGRLKLASAGSSASDAADGDGSATEAEGTSTGSLRDQLIEVREDMLSTQEENRELRERNSMLEEQLESQKKLIQLQNEQLARLQEYYRRLNEQGGDSTGLQKPDVTTPAGTEETAAVDETADEAVTGTTETDVATETDEVTAGSTEPVDETVPAEAAEAVETAGDESPAEEAPAAQAGDETAAPVAEEEPQQQEVQGETSFLASLMKNNTVVYGATATGIGILGLLALWLMRRRKATEEAEENIRAAELATREPPAPEKPVAPLAAIDVLDKVDPLMARDEFAEARTLLENAILEEPTRYELHLKMLDLMYATDDLEGFEEYHAMLEAADFPVSNPESWTKVEQQYEELQAQSGGGKPGGDAAQTGGAVAATGSAAVAAAALDQFAEIDETEDDLMPGVEDEEALEAIQKLNTSLDEVSFEDLDTLPEEAEEESEEKGEETSAQQEHSLSEDLGEQDDLESALKLFEMELEGRHPDASGISDETKAELAETAELLETDNLAAEEQPQDDEIDLSDEEGDLDLDFSAASEALDHAEEEPVDTIDMETAEAGEKSTPVSEEEVQAKVELAEAFAEMGDVEGAREILNEVMREGTESQRMTAEEILQKYAS
jgi:pilus assembly protein FimV